MIPDADAGTPDSSTSDSGTNDGGPTPQSAPRAVSVARTTMIPACTVFVDGANAGPADGSAAQPYPTIAAAIAALDSGAVVCVAEGTYAEAVEPGIKYFTLAGGFQSNQSFTVRDSSQYVTRAQGDGTNVFFNSVDPGPTEGQLTVIDGFEVTGYSQGIVRDIYYSQSFDITNNYIHDNLCAQAGLIGGGFLLTNASGTISSNVITRNTCYRGGAGAIGDSTNSNSVSITNNLIDSNAGDQPDISHGGGLYLLVNDATVTGNEFVDNTVTAWGGGLYVGADPGQGLQATAVLSWNVYRNNRAVQGGGFFCDDAARCMSDHEIYENNCGGNIFLDSGPDLTTPTIATFDHLTSYIDPASGCPTQDASIQVSKNNNADDTYSFTNSIFWGNATDHDFNASCGPTFCNATVTVAYSNVKTNYPNNGITISFGAGNMNVDPLFVNAEAGDFHLQSTQGHWTPAGYVQDAADSPALATGDPSGSVSDNPPRAGDRTEMGAYGNSVEASYVR